MNNSLKAPFLIPIATILGFFLYWLISHYLFRDLVWDELVSLKNFTLVDLITSVSHYPDVNNHVFFNLINNLYCKIIGIASIYEAMDSVLIVRLFPAFLSLLTIYFTYKSTNKAFGQMAGFISVIILLTCIPFLNFTMQLRGYTMSMTFMAMALYYLWDFEDKPSIFNASLSALSIFGMLYAIPSNIYFVLSLGIIYTSKWVIASRKSHSADNVSSTVNSWFKTNGFYLLLLIGLGTALAFLAYLPILEDILNERHLQQLKGKSFYSYNLTKVIPFVLFYILSYRFLLIIPLLFIGAVGFSKYRKKEWKEEHSKALILFLTILVSFGISLLRGDKPHQRTFTPIAVVFSILAGGATHSYLKSLKWLTNRELTSYVIVFVYCVSSFYYCDNLIQKTLHKAIISGDKTYNMFYNFYQSQEYGMKNLDVLIDEVKTTNYPVFFAREIDRVAEGEYLLKHGILYHSTVWAKPSKASNEAGFEYKVLFEIANGKGTDASYKTIGFPPTIEKESSMLVPLFTYLYQTETIDQQNPAFYVVTFSPRWFEGVMKKSLPTMKYIRLNKRSNYHNIYLVTPK